jgi:hypothetical protein
LSWLPGWVMVGETDRGYVGGMSEMADNQRPVEIEGVPEGEEISEADVAERVDEDPEEQENRHDPVWTDSEPED